MDVRILMRIHTFVKINEGMEPKQAFAFPIKYYYNGRQSLYTFS